MSWRLLRSATCVLALLGLAVLAAPAEPSKPTPNYKLAAKFSSANLAPLTYSSMVTPGWIGKTDRFWYSYRTSKGTRFWKVDPERKTKVELFDHEKVASQLAELCRKPQDANLLQLERGEINSEATKFSFVYTGMQYDYDLAKEKLTLRGKAEPPRTFPGFKGKSKRAEDDEPQDVDKTKEKKKDEKTRVITSPDRKSSVFIKENNLYLAEAGKEKSATQLTKDGSADYSFVLSGAFTTSKGPTKTSTLPRETWAKDSRHFYSYRMDSRGMKELFVINSLATPRPTLEQYKYSMPGEDNIRKTELHVGSRDGKTLERVPPKWQDESYSDVHWGKTPGELRFFRRDRLLRNLEFCALDIPSGKCRVLISESFENGPVNVLDVQLRYLEDSDEMIWWSERTGWGHFYLYSRNGDLKARVTSGSWRAGDIEAIDEKARVVYFRGSGREKGENVYFRHLYRVGLDGTGLTLLDPGDALHLSRLSPTRKVVVDNAMRIDRCPESILRDASGKKIMDLEKSDLSRLEEYGWKLPETFTVKAGDGVTDLYGNMWKPFDFDPKKKYPIIANVYPGPQTEGVDEFYSVYSSTMQLAQLGFIVIQVGHRGGSPYRSKAYGSYGYFNLRDYGLSDKKTAIEQLAARHTWIDLDKVGLYGHSGGGFMSAAAMMQKPYNEFFKAAVATAGNHDNNIYNNWWSERHHGLKEIAVKAETKDKTKTPVDMEPAAPPLTLVTTPPPVTKVPAAPPTKVKFEIKVPTNAELAANLKGRLLLVHGEIDTNVHPANTMRLVDALIKANKRFDLLIIPAKRHSFGDATPYVRRRTWEFFAEHLLGDRRIGAEITEE